MHVAGVDELPSVLGDLAESADALMVARGDLGIDCPPEDVPHLQKRIIRHCVEVGTPVLTATQMLESMIERPLPTRAEASDVANAVFDGTDAVMLSGETAVGKHPVESVAMAGSIVAEAEAEMFRGRPPRAFRAAHTSFPAAIGEAAAVAAEAVGAKCIVVYTHAGY